MYVRGSVCLYVGGRRYTCTVICSSQTRCYLHGHERGHLCYCVELCNTACYCSKRSRNTKPEIELGSSCMYM